MERAAALAVLLNDLRTLCDAEARELTTIAKQLELLRLPTPPDIHHITAVQRVSEAVELFLNLADRLRFQGQTFDARVRDEAATLAEAQGDS